MKKLNLIKKTGCCCSTIDINEDDIAMDFFEDIYDEEFKVAAGYNMGIKTDGEFCGKALYLDYTYDYVLGKDSNGNIILVPLKKK